MIARVCVNITFPCSKKCMQSMIWKWTKGLFINELWDTTWHCLPDYHSLLLHVDTSYHHALLPIDLSLYLFNFFITECSYSSASPHPLPPTSFLLTPYLVPFIPHLTPLPWTKIYLYVYLLALVSTRPSRVHLWLGSFFLILCKYILARLMKFVS